MAMDEKGLGRRLQTARQHAGLTQQQLCQKAHLSYSTLAKIERGAIKAPSIFTIQTIAQVLGVSLDELIGHAPKPTVKQRTKSGISFIYLDINGCLVRFFHRAFTAIAQNTGLSPNVIETAFWSFNDDVCTGKMSPAEFDEAFARRLNIDKISWQDYYLAAVDPIPEMHELVRWAADRYHVGLFSNIGSGFIDDMMSKGLLPAVEYSAIADSSRLGVIKPEPEIYVMAEEMAGVPAKEILFIDDSRANLAPAQARGWHVMWFNDYDTAESAERVRAALEPAD